MIHGYIAAMINGYIAHNRRNAPRPDPALIERVRELADTNAIDPDSALDFYSAAIELGQCPGMAERIDAILNARVMRARGAI